MCIFGFFDLNAKVIMLSLLLFILICVDVNSGAGISRDSKHNSSTVSYPFVNPFERDSRQTYGGYSGYGGYGAPVLDGGIGAPIGGFGTFGGPLEAVVIGLLVVVGISVVGLPVLLLFMNMFNGNALTGGGLNLLPTVGSTVGTTVAGRRKRDVNRLLPNVNPIIQEKLISIFDTFNKTPDKSNVMKQLLESIIAQ